MSRKRTERNIESVIVDSDVMIVGPTPPKQIFAEIETEPTTQELFDSINNPPPAPLTNGISTMDTSITKILCEKLNALNSFKPMQSVADFQLNEWTAVNHIKFCEYRDKKSNNIINVVHFDLPQCILLAPTRQKLYILNEVFGITESGKKLPKKGNQFLPYVQDNTLLIPSLEICVSKEETVNAKTYYKLEFRDCDDLTCYEKSE